jgi:hypothetical protein
MRAVVNDGLKGALGIPRQAPPIVEYGQFAVAPNLGLGGTRQVEQTDIDWP